MGCEIVPGSIIWDVRGEKEQGWTYLVLLAREPIISAELSTACPVEVNVAAKVGRGNGVRVSLREVQFQVNVTVFAMVSWLGARTSGGNIIVEAEVHDSCIVSELGADTTGRAARAGILNA